MYKKHGEDWETSLERQVKALVAKVLEEQGLSTEPRTLMTSSRELALVGSLPKVSSSQGSTAAITPVDRIREPTSYTLVVLIDRQNTMMEVAKGMAHPPGGLHHNNKISPDYTRVGVHSVKPKFMQWTIGHPTPEGQITQRSNQPVHPWTQTGHCIEGFFAAYSMFGGTF